MGFLDDLILPAPRKLVVPDSSIVESNVSAAAGAVYTVNDAEFVPFTVPPGGMSILDIDIVVAVQNGNLDIGIYTLAGARIVSLGSTAVGAAGLQTLNITDKRLGPGQYYLGFATSSATATFQSLTPKGGASVGAAALVGARRMATAFPLPATATFVVPTRTTMILAALRTAA